MYSFLNFGVTHALFTIQYLPMNIRKGYRIIVDQAKHPYASASQIRRCRASQSPKANDQYPGSLKLELT